MGLKIYLKGANVLIEEDENKTPIPTAYTRFNIIEGIVTITDTQRGKSWTEGVDLIENETETIGTEELVYEYLSQFIGLFKNGDSEDGVTIAQVNEIISDKTGQPEGLASLDEDGKMLLSQMPDMNEVFPTVNTYSLLPSAEHNINNYCRVSQSQGIRYLPGNLGGTYYAPGFYQSNGIVWNYVGEQPYQASQSSVDDGISEYQFVSPKTLKDSTLMSSKVDKIDGKQLSTEDYSSVEKSKLSGIAADAQKNVQVDWDSTLGDSYILNKPSIPIAQQKSDWTSEFGPTEIVNKPISFPSSPHSHSSSDVLGLNAAISSNTDVSNNTSVRHGVNDPNSSHYSKVQSDLNYETKNINIQAHIADSGMHFTEQKVLDTLITGVNTTSPINATTLDKLLIVVNKIIAWAKTHYESTDPHLFTPKYYKQDGTPVVGVKIVNHQVTTDATGSFNVSLAAIGFTEVFGASVTSIRAFTTHADLTWESVTALSTTTIQGRLVKSKTTLVSLLGVSIAGTELVGAGVNVMLRIEGK